MLRHSIPVGDLSGHHNSHEFLRRLIRGMMLGAIGESLLGRYAQVKAAVLEEIHKATVPASSGLPLVPWIFLHDPLERFFSNYQRTFDAWAEGGVRGIVVGRLI